MKWKLSICHIFLSLCHLGFAEFPLTNDFTVGLLIGVIGQNIESIEKWRCYLFMSSAMFCLFLKLLGKLEHLSICFIVVILIHQKNTKTLHTIKIYWFYRNDYVKVKRVGTVELDSLKCSWWNIYWIDRYKRYNERDYLKRMVTWNSS